MPSVPETPKHSPLPHRENAAMISVENLSLDYSSQRALHHITFQVPRGTSAALVGPSGCGKTSLLYLISGLLQPTEGTLSIPQDLQPPGLLFQQDLLLPWKRIRNNLLLGMEKSDKNLEKADNLLQRLHIGEQAQKYPYQLSGGQRQRASLARTLIGDPGLLLLDEPTASLDEITKEKLQNDLKRTVKEQKLTMIFVTHNIEEALFLGSRILVMKKGEILESMENNSWFLEDQRNHPDFFDGCCRVRKLLARGNQGES